MSRLIHYSNKPLKKVWSVEQEDPTSTSFTRKPEGLWVSVEGEDDWHEWCTSEEFRVELLACATEVVLKPDAKILRLSTASQLDQLESEYGVPDEVLKSSRISYVSIQWERVAEKYQGIIIAPYMWSCRLDMMWYYAWDCASGCIWDADAVAELRPIEQEPRIARTA